MALEPTRDQVDAMMREKFGDINEGVELKLSTLQVHIKDETNEVQVLRAGENEDPWIIEASMETVLMILGWLLCYPGILVLDFYVVLYPTSPLADVFPIRFYLMMDPIGPVVILRLHLASTARTLDCFFQFFPYLHGFHLHYLPEFNDEIYDLSDVQNMASFYYAVEARFDGFVFDPKPNLEYVIFFPILRIKFGWLDRDEILLIFKLFLQASRVERCLDMEIYTELTMDTRWMVRNYIIEIGVPKNVTDHISFVLEEKCIRIKCTCDRMTVLRDARERSDRVREAIGE